MSDVGELLYHYTSPAGLIGILDSDSLWLTNIQSLNDEEEFENGFRLIEEVVEEMRKSLDADPPEVVASTGGKVFANQEFAQFVEFMSFMAPQTDYRMNPRLSLFVSSLSTKRDDLSQWRGYCPHSGGYSIGFDRKKLETLQILDGPRLCEGTRKTEGPKLSLPGPFIGECIYDDREKKERARQLAEAWLAARQNERAQPMSLEEVESYSEKTLEKPYSELLTLACCCKDKAFEDESEIRLIQLISANVLDRYCQFSPAEGYVKPHVALSRPSQAIREIVVGPTKDEARAIAGVQVLIASKVLAASVDIVPSGVPFRNG